MSAQDAREDRWERFREALRRAPGVAAEPSARVEALVAEARPFFEAAERSFQAREAALPGDARSLAFLFAYRLGDQGYAALAPAAALAAWRGTWTDGASRDALEEVSQLVLDGYARGREDRARAEAQKALADALPVAPVAPGVVLVIAAGPLEADGARALAERAGSVMLRADARTALLDVGGLVAPTGAALAEVWGVVAAAQMLGVRCVVSGATPALGLALDEAPVPELALRTDTLAEGFQQALREAGVGLGAPRGFASWARSLLSRG
ncbi:MAG: hypothetical protein HY909_05935 [Deltaproteobacteria bacterium]|nr:hypothetical protein [Deltaproteobacteria bacterium]